MSVVGKYTRRKKQAVYFRDSRLLAIIQCYHTKKMIESIEIYKRKDHLYKIDIMKILRKIIAEAKDRRLQTGW